jgi:site-specific DNA-methyltransferase (adenine-specific)
MITLNKIYNEDCRETMKRMPDNFVDSIVTDPPYGISFMGKEWDSFDIKYQEKKAKQESKRKPRTDGRSVTGFQSSVYAGLYDLTPKGMMRFQRWYCEIMTEAYRILKPGGYVLSFGSPRTYHRMACAIEDAGFEIRDSIMWIFGSGFPKSMNLGNGFGTALKPAHEPICVARKPIAEKTVAQNVLKYGTGGINIDGCRIGLSGEPAPKGSAKRVYKSNHFTEDRVYGNNTTTSSLGRFPANIILDPFTAGLLDKQVPMAGAFAKVKSGHSGKSNGIYSDYATRGDDGDTFYDDKGGASRLFYVAKADKEERNAGLHQFEKVRHADRNITDGVGGENPRNRNNTNKNNFHPTVKPVKLIQYLIRLVTPKGGVSYDPFGGSGTHALASQNEGFNWILSEIGSEYCDIAEKRIYNNGGLFL